MSRQETEAEESFEFIAVGGSGVKVLASHRSQITPAVGMALRLELGEECGPTHRSLEAQRTRHHTPSRAVTQINTFTYKEGQLCLQLLLNHARRVVRLPQILLSPISCAHA